MKTAERILAASIELFNDQGVARVSTNAIADAAELSPGNLYYHYKNKEDILLALFKQLQSALAPLLSQDEPVDSWLDWFDWWQAWFGQVMIFNFIFHDPHYLLTSNEHISFRYHQMIEQLEQKQRQIFSTMKQKSQLVATDTDIERLASQVTFVAVFWQDYLSLKTHRRRGPSMLRSALQQISGLMLPYLDVTEQLALEQLMAQAELT